MATAFDFVNFTTLFFKQFLDNLDEFENNFVFHMVKVVPFIWATDAQIVEHFHVKACLSFFHLLTMNTNHFPFSS